MITVIRKLLVFSFAWGAIWLFAGRFTNLHDFITWRFWAALICLAIAIGIAEEGK